MIDITMPRLSDTMEEGAIATWHKHPGDTVAVGDLLVEIETDKASMEYEAYDAGTLAETLVEEGAVVSIGTVIARLDNGVEAPPTPAQESTGSEPQHPEGPAVAESPGGRVAFASPLARKLAREHHVDLAGLHGSGPGGRLVRADILSLIAEGAPADDAPKATAPSVEPASADPQAPDEMPNPDDTMVPMSPARRVIARRLSESAHTVPHFTVTTVVDVEALIALREDVNRSLAARSRAKVSVNDLLIRAVALTLRDHPDVNVSYHGGPTPSIVQHGHIAIGVAIAAPHGLVVPVVHDADGKSVSRIGEEVRELSSRASDRRLTLAEMSGGTFTVSNLGMFGVESFTAIINPPECAILAVGVATPEPVAQDGEVVVRHRMRLTLSADHRVIDGALAARFLQTLKGRIEDPWAVLV